MWFGEKQHAPDETNKALGFFKPQECSWCPKLLVKELASPKQASFTLLTLQRFRQAGTSWKLTR
jgi:hypothetical protein